MGIPRVPEQVRRAPLVALRAVFACFGRVLMWADRPVPVAEVAQPGSRFRSLDQTGNVRLLRARDTRPAQEAGPAEEAGPAQEAAPVREPSQAPNLADGSVAAAATAPGVADGIGDAADLPVPNYDTLSLASIRARLRGLDVAQLKVLLDYEAANAERAELLGMFERRIEKLEAGM